MEDKQEENNKKPENPNNTQGSPSDELDVRSDQEDGLLGSSDAETVVDAPSRAEPTGRVQGDRTTLSAEEKWKEARKRHRREHRARKRQRQREEERMKRQPQGTNPEAAANPEPQRPGTSSSAVEGGDVVTGDDNSSLVPRNADRRPTAATRGPKARDSRRDAKQIQRQLKIRGPLPTGPREKSQETPKESSGKRQRTDKETPPGRQSKRPRNLGSRGASTAAPPGTSPLLRGDARRGPPERNPGGSTGEAYSSASRREMQVVFLSDREGGRIEAEEAEAIRAHIIAQGREAMRATREGPNRLVLRYQNSGFIEAGWFLVTAQDSQTVSWLAEGCPPLVREGRTFRSVRAVDAPWPVEVTFTLKAKEEPNLRQVEEDLDLQNPSLNVARWQHQRTEGEPGDWRVYYRITREDMRALQEADWMLCLELLVIRVYRVTIRRAPAKPGGSSDPQTEK